MLGKKLLPFTLLGLATQLWAQVWIAGDTIAGPRPNPQWATDSLGPQQFRIKDSVLTVLRSPKDSLFLGRICAKVERHLLIQTYQSSENSFWELDTLGWTQTNYGIHCLGQWPTPLLPPGLMAHTSLQGMRVGSEASASKAWTWKTQGAQSDWQPWCWQYNQWTKPDSLSWNIQEGLASIRRTDLSPPCLWAGPIPKDPANKPFVHPQSYSPNSPAPFDQLTIDLSSITFLNDNFIVKIIIRDKDGRQTRTLHQGFIKQERIWKWDGLDNQGQIPRAGRFWAWIHIQDGQHQQTWQIPFGMLP